MPEPLTTPAPIYEVERDRLGVMFSGPLDVGECMRLVPVERCEATHARDMEYIRERDERVRLLEAREVELAEALRDLDAAWSEYSHASLSGWASTHRDALQAIRDRVHGTFETFGLLEGAEERSHEVVPLGTEDALRDLTERARPFVLMAGAYADGDDEAAAKGADEFLAALGRAEKVTEGAEPARPTPSGDSITLSTIGSRIPVAVAPSLIDDARVSLRLGLHDGDLAIAFTEPEARWLIQRFEALVEGVEPDRHSDVHRCEDCGVPTCRPIGSYWLASDELWAQVVGDNTIVLCPACFHDRAETKDINVSWRAVVEESEPARYECPIHRSRRFTAPGQCPVMYSLVQKCDLQLVPVEGVERTPTPAEADDCDETVCRRCGGSNSQYWSAASPLWNAVMRGGSINGPGEYGEIICPTCFMLLAEERGIATYFHVDAREVHVELETVTPSGRVWDPKAFMWVEPGEPSPSGITDERVAKLVKALEDVASVAERESYPKLARFARQALDDADQAGERTHTLVPNEVLEEIASLLVLGAGAPGRRCGELAERIRAAARDDRSVRWPGDDTAGQEGPDA